MHINWGDIRAISARHADMRCTKLVAREVVNAAVDKAEKRAFAREEQANSALLAKLSETDHWPL